MAGQLENDIKRYLDIWTDIKNGGIAKELPLMNKDKYLKELTKEIEVSFKDSDTKQQMETFHKVTTNLHYLRDILINTEYPLLNLRGLKHVIK